MTIPAKRRVAVVYQHLPHYREPVFRLMSESVDIEYHFLADPRGEDGIQTVPVGHLPHTHHLSNRWVGPFLVQRGLFATLRQIRPEAVIFLGDYRYLTTWINAAIQRTIGVRVFFWTQGWRRTETGPRAVVRNSFYRLAHHLFVYGARSRQLGIEAGFSPDTITAIGNSQGTVAELDHVPTLLRSTEDLRIGAVMRLSPNKKVAQLADIAAELIENGQPTRVHVAGQGSDMEALKDACAAANVPLRAYGPLHSDDELDDFYADLDVCVIPGAAGLSVLQALSHGRPVVTNDTLNTQGPEVEAIAVDRTGTLVQEDDIHAFSEAISVWARRIRADATAVSAACVESVRRGWVADRQAELIAQKILPEATPRTKIAVLNPNAGRGNYSGPNIFMERLFSGNPGIAATIVTGNAEASDVFPWATVATPTNYDRSGRLSQVRWLLSATRWLWSNSRQFDAIHAHGIYLFNLLPLKAAQLRKVPVILVPLGENAELGFARGQRRQALSNLRRCIVSRASLGLGLSLKTQRELVAAGASPEKVRSIGNPVDTETFTPPSPDNRFSLQTVGFVGALSDNKGPHIILEALANLHATSEFDHVRASFVGPFYDTVYEAWFKERVHTLGLDSFVTVVGYTANVADHLSSMSVFALPSAQEGLPGALVEAMASGLPAVVTDVGAMGDVVRAADAGCVVPREAIALSEAIASLLGDADHWAQMSRNAHTHAIDRYSIPSVQHQYQEAIDSIFTHQEPIND